MAKKNRDEEILKSEGLDLESEYKNATGFQRIFLNAERRRAADAINRIGDLSRDLATSYNNTVASARSRYSPVASDGSAINYNEKYVSADDARAYERAISSAQVKAGETSAQINKILRNYGRYLDDNSYSKISDFVSNITDSYGSIYNNARNDTNYRAGFKDQADFDTQWKTQRDLYETPIEELEARAASLNKDLDILNKDRMNRDLDSAFPEDSHSEEYKALFLGDNAPYKSASDLETRAAEANALVNRAKNARKATEIEDSMARHYSESIYNHGVELVNAVTDEELGDLPRFGNDSDNAVSLNKLAKRIAPQGENDLLGIRNNLFHLSDTQKNTLISLLGRGGQKAAWDYYTAIEDQLAMQEGMRKRDSLLELGAIGSLAEVPLELITGMGKTLTQIADGVGAAFGNGKDYYAGDATDYAMQLLRQHYKDSGDSFYSDWVLAGAEQIGTQIPAIAAGHVAGAVAGAISGAAGMTASTVAKVTNIATKVGFSAPFAVSAFGGAYKEMINAGYSPDQAATYGVINAISETTLQNLLGGIMGGVAPEKLGGAALAKYTAATSGVKSALGRFAVKAGAFGIKALASASGEFIEESLQEILDPYFKNFVTGQEIEPAKLSDALYAGLMGALTSFVLEGASNASEINALNKTGRQVLTGEQGGFNVDTLKQIGSQFDASSLAAKLASKIDVNSTPLSIGMLMQEVGANLNSLNQSEITGYIERRYGLPRETIETYVKGYADYINRYSLLNDSQQEDLKNALKVNVPLNAGLIEFIANNANDTQLKNRLDRGGIALNSGTSDFNVTAASDILGNTEVQSRNRAYTQLAENVYGEGTQLDFARQERGIPAILDSAPLTGADAIARQGLNTEYNPRISGAVAEAKARQDAELGDYKVSKDGQRRVNGKVIRPVNFSNTDIDGDIGVRLSNGETVSAKNIEYGSKNDVQLIHAINSLRSKGSIGTNNRGFLFNVWSRYDGKTDPETYLNAAVEAYRRGYLDQTLNVESSTDSVKKIAQATAESFWEDGQRERKADDRDADAAKKARNKERETNRREGSTRETARVSYDESVDETKLKKHQRVFVDVARVVTQNNYMPNVRFFASSVDENGKRYFESETEGRISSNGWYDPKTNTIWVDVNAGLNGEGAILYTLSHELTHWAKAYTSTEAYNAFSKFVLDNYARKGVSVTELVKAEQNLAKKRGRNLNDPQALDEVIANACEAMLADPDVVRKLAALNEKNPGLVKKILNHISGLLNKLARVIKAQKFEPTTTAGRIAANFDGLANRWTDLVKQANNNFKYVTEQGEGETAYQFRGEKSVGAESDPLLAEAKAMSERGVDSETIRQKTGWFKSYDGKWRTEIDDSKAKIDKGNAYKKVKAQYDAENDNIEKLLKQGILTEARAEKLRQLNEEELREYTDQGKGVFELQDVLRHDDLFRAYPAFRTLTVEYKTLKDGVRGQYNRENGSIEINNKLSSRDELSTLLHEIQHLIQSEEGFARGSNLIEAEAAIEDDTRALRKEASAKMHEAREAVESYIDSYIQKHFPRAHEIKKLYGGSYDGFPAVLEAYYYALTEMNNKGEFTEDRSVADAIMESARSKYKRFDPAVFSRIDELTDAYKKAATDFTNVRKNAETPFQRYQRTAGEVEARDVQSRMDMTAEERRSTRPNIDRTDVVFVEGEGAALAQAADAKIKSGDVAEGAVDVLTGEKDYIQHQYRAMETDKEEYRAVLKEHGKMSDAEINVLFGTIDKALEKVKANLDILDYAWDENLDNRTFEPVKPNSDKLYKVSLDFSTLCRKRLLQQAIQERLEGQLKRALTKEERIAIRGELKKLKASLKNIEIACALCYVESARLKSPNQINKFLDNSERVLREYYAYNSEEGRRAMAAAEEQKKEDLGYKGKALKEIPKKVADQIRAAKKKAAMDLYTPTAQQQKNFDVLKGLTVSDFNSSDGLANLRRTHWDIYDAYSSYVRNATKSKGLESDTWYRRGDAQRSIGDKLIAQMNAENGLRSQSWSDFQVKHLLDYIGAVIDLSVLDAKLQTYTKVPDFVRLMGNTNAMINLSLIPTAEYNGEPISAESFDDVEGIPLRTALDLRNKYHQTAGTIAIGMSNEQTKALLESLDIDYVIPYHKSSLDQASKLAMGFPSWHSFEKFQNEKEISEEEAKKVCAERGVEIDEKNWHKEVKFSDWFDLEKARATQEANHDPNNVMAGGYAAMLEAAERYKDICAQRGFAPKFSEGVGNFANEANYWKLLIDRKMVDNVTGEIIEQKAVTPNFNQNDVLGILNEEVARAPQVRADEEAAKNIVVDAFTRAANGKNTAVTARQLAKAMQAQVDNMTTYTGESEQDNGIQHQEREISNRELLADALASNAAAGESGIISRYRSDLEKVNSEIRKRDSLKEEIASLRETKPEGAAKRISELRSELIKTNNRIAAYDKQLTRLEAMRPMKELVSQQRTDAKAVQRAFDQRRIDRINEKNALTVSDLRAAQRAELRAAETQAKRDVREARKEGKREVIEKLTKQQNLERINTILADMYKRAVTPSKDAYMPEGLREPVQDLVSALTEQTVTAKTFKDALDAIRNTVKPMVDSGAMDAKDAEVLNGRFDNALNLFGIGDTELAAMTNEQLDAVKRTLKAVSTVIGNANKLLQSDIKASRREAGINSMVQIKNQEKKSSTNTVALKGKEYTYNLLRPTYFFKDVVGSEVISQLFDEMQQKGEADYGRRLQEATDFFSALSEKYEERKWKYNEKKVVKDIDPALTEEISDSKKLYDAIVSGDSKTVDSIRNAKQYNGMRVYASSSEFDSAVRRALRTNDERIAEASEAKKSGDEEAYKRIVDEIAAEGNFSKADIRQAIGTYSALATREQRYGKGSTKEERRQAAIEAARMANPDLYGAATGDFELTLGQCMALYAYSKRAQGLLHLLSESGGIELEENVVHRITQETLDHIANDILTPDQKAFVDEAVNFLSTTVGGWGNEVTETLYGEDFFTEEYYLPILTTRFSRSFNPEQLENAVTRDLSRGFTKALDPNARNAIVINDFLQIWAKHVTDMATYSAFAVRQRNFNAVYNFKTDSNNGVRQYIARAFGDPANAYIRDLLTDMNTSRRKEGGGVDKTLSFLLSTFKRAKVAANIAVVVQQPFSICRAFPYIEAKYLHPGDFNIIGKNAKRDIELMHKYAPVSVIKDAGGFDMGSRLSHQDYILGRRVGTWKQVADAKISEITGFLAAKADLTAWTAMWRMAVRKAQVQGLTGEAMYQRAGQLFTKAITLTQVYDSTLSRPGAMRGGSAASNAATAFMSEPLTTLSMAMDGAKEIKNGNKAFGGKIMASVAMATLMTNIARALWYATRDDDDDEAYVEKFLESFSEGFFNDLLPVNYLPIIKDMYSVLQGYTSKNTVTAPLTDFVSSFKKVTDKIFSGTAGINDYLNALGTLADLTGIPLKNLVRDGRAIVNMIGLATDEVEPNATAMRKSFWSGMVSAIPALGLFGGSENRTDALYGAVMVGDAQYYARLVNSHKENGEKRYPDQKSLNTALKKGLRDNDKRIAEAAAARNAGDFSTYSRIVNEIVGEKHFNKALVVDAIAAEAKALTTSAETPVEDTAPAEADSTLTGLSANSGNTGIYASRDISTAVQAFTSGSGDEDTLLNIVDELIEDKVSEGMTLSKAKASVKASTTTALKAAYKTAYAARDRDTMKQIRELMRKTKLYGGTTEVKATADKWLES